MGICVKIPNGFLTLSKIDFKCPYCLKQYEDDDDIYLNRCNKNKSNFTKIKCTCDNKFGFTYDITGTARSFKL